MGWWPTFFFPFFILVRVSGGGGLSEIWQPCLIQAVSGNGGVIIISICWLLTPIETHTHTHPNSRSHNAVSQMSKKNTSWFIC